MEPEATLHVSITWCYVMLARNPKLILTYNKDLKLYFFNQSRRALYQPIRNFVITTNYVRLNNLPTSHDPIHLASLYRSSSSCTLHAALCYILCRQKYAINIPISTEAHKSFENLKIFKIQNFENFGALFWPLFGLLGLSPQTFRNSWALPQNLPSFQQMFLLPFSR